MRVTCIAARELDDGLVRRWHELQSHPDHPEWLHPFLSAEFFRLTAQIRTASRLAVIEDAGRIVGLWAFEATLPGLASPLARHMSDLQGVLVDPQWARDFGSQTDSLGDRSVERGNRTDDLRRPARVSSPGDLQVDDTISLLRWIARQAGLRYVGFDHLLPLRPAGWTLSPGAYRACGPDGVPGPQGAMMMSRYRSPGWPSVTSTTRTRWMIGLQDGFDAYHREQMPRTRWWRRAPGKARKLVEAMGPITWQDDIRDDAAWLALARWKSAQYRASGLRDNFSIGWVRQWLERLRWADAPGLRGSLQSLRAGGQLVAVHFGVQGHHILHHYLPAYDHELAVHSPGSVLLQWTIEKAVDQGVSLIDLSTGDMDYKQAVSNRQGRLAIGGIGPSGLLHLQALARQTAACLRGCPGLLPVARRGRRAWVRFFNGPRPDRGAADPRH